MLGSERLGRARIGEPPPLRLAEHPPVRIGAAAIRSRLPVWRRPSFEAAISSQIACAAAEERRGWSRE